MRLVPHLVEHIVLTIHARDAPGSPTVTAPAPLSAMARLTEEQKARQALTGRRNQALAAEAEHQRIENKIESG